MDEPLISVVIPMFNSERTIEAALVSVKSQTWDGRFEIFVVDDGSTDGSRTVVENYIRENPGENIHLIIQENAGVSAARNAGLRSATGDYIALLDADDLWYPEKTEIQMLFLKNNPGIDFLGCRVRGHTLRYPYSANQNGYSVISFRKLMFRNEIRTCTVLFKRNIIERCGFFDDGQRHGEDLNYWLRISEHFNMAILDEELVSAGGGKRSFGVSGLSADLSAMERGFQKNLAEMRVAERITLLEFNAYFLFYKGKYLVRIARSFILKKLKK